MTGMRPQLNKDTTFCISLASRPSNFGTRFHNFLYEEIGLDFLYKAMTTTDIEAAIGGVRALGIRGCSVSMPFKEAVIPLVDHLDASATAIDSVNTIVNDAGTLSAYNTDYIAAATLLRTHDVDTSSPFVLRGSGGMAKAVLAAMRDHGLRDGTVIARNERTGRALAGQYGFGWRAELGDAAAPLLVNVTPIGMAGDAQDELAYPEWAVTQASVVFDVVALPSETPLIRAARDAGIRVITGAEVIALQAAEQFELYTGVRLTDDQVLRASQAARA